MEYTISNFIRKYFERYCRTVLNVDPDPITEKACPIFDRLMHETPDMGGKDNMMASNMDMTVAFFAYYEASNHQIGGEAIETLVNWLADDYQWLTFLTDINKRHYMIPLYYKIYTKHAEAVKAHKAKDEWPDAWSFDINPEGKTEGIAYHMSCCPLLAFVRAHGYDEMMPYICKFDFIFEKILHARLIRTQTEALGADYCDYWFLPDQSETAKQYQDFVSV